MKVKITIDTSIEEMYIEVHTPKINEEVHQIEAYFQDLKPLFPVKFEDTIKVLKPQDIYLVKSIEGVLHVETKNDVFYSNKKLYEVPIMMGSTFLRISKNTYMNLDYLDSVEATFSGMMKVKLTNGKTDYISRIHYEN
ncbi:MAG: LytTR family DNA-binding domain-containing protein [Acholeplasmataceae bacterium]